MGLPQAYSRMHRRSAVALCSALLAALLVAAGGVVLGQGQKVDIAKDAIFARKIPMDTINSNMDAIETMIAAGKAIDLTEAREHAALISVMLMAFPHLFPASTNQWQPNRQPDPWTDSYATPDVWTN